MKISELPVAENLTDEEIKNGYVLGMKNVYPNDKVPVYELQRFPITAYLSDIDMNATKQLIQRMRNINEDITIKKSELETLVDNVQTVTSSEVNAANLQPIDGVVSYDYVTSQLTSKFASPDELQTAVNNVYSALFSAVEDMMVQVFTTSMYARQYTPMLDGPSATVYS